MSGMASVDDNDQDTDLEHERDGGTPGRCWVCDRDYAHSITDFEPYGPHSACAAMARRMDSDLHEQRRRRNAATAGGVDFNAWTVQW